MPFSLATAMSIQDGLEAKAHQTPDALAIKVPGCANVTYAGLVAHSEKIATRLGRSGIDRNDRVGLVLADGPSMVAGMLGVMSCAVAAPLNPSSVPRELEFFISDLGLRFLLIGSDLDSPAREMARKRGINIVEISSGSFACPDKSEWREERPGATNKRPNSRREDIAVVLHTSGTTSRPKIVPLTQANLLASVENIVQTLKLSTTDRCLTVMPLFHIHGLMVTLSALLSGGQVCPVHLDSHRFFDLLAESGATWYSAVPTMHQAILKSPGSDRYDANHSKLRFVRSSSAALPARVKSELERTLNVPVIEAYGMTEAAHQIASNPLPPGERKPGSVGLAAGPQIAVMDERGELVPSFQRGEIVIRGDNVFRGYENADAASASAFGDGWFKTGDQGYLDAEGYLFLTGRFKDIISRGGEKISPAEVDELLLSHPAVEQAITFSIPHPTLGEDVAAAVVPREGSTISESEVRSFVAKSLVRFKVPRRVLVVAQIPKGSTGKIQRSAMAEKLGLINAKSAKSVSTPAYVAPQKMLEQRLVALWEDLLEARPIGIRDDFFDLGGNSLLALQLLNKIEGLTGIRLPLGSLFEAPTIEQMARLLQSNDGSSHWKSSVAIQPHGSKPPFFCVHAHEGNVLFYRHLARYLGLDQPFYGIQAQGVDGKQTPLNRIESMAEHYIEEIRSVQPAGPYFLGGYCFGGIVAFEIAQKLHAQGDRVALLALLYTNAPQYWNRSISLHEKLQFIIRKVDFHLNNLLFLPGREKLVYLTEHFESLKTRLSTILGFTLARTEQAVVTANAEALSKYRPHIYQGHLTLFQGTKQFVDYDDPTSGWRDLTAGGITIHRISKYGESIILEPRVRILAERLRTCLKAAQSNTTDARRTAEVSDSDGAVLTTLSDRKE